MRILYWTPLFWPEIGGIEAIAMNVLPALRARGHDVMGVASHGPLELPDRSEYDGIPVYRYHMFNALWKKDPKLLMGITKKIANLKRSFQPDIVHMLFGPPALAYFHFQTMKAHPSPTLLTVHADLTNASTGPDTLLWRMLQNADWITSDAEITLSHVRKIYPQIGERTAVIHNGFPMPDLEPADLQFEEPHLVCVGRLAHEKGFDIAIAAFSQVLKRFPDTHLTIAGDGPLRRELEELASEQGLNGHVHFPGAMPHGEIPALLNTATLVVIPSRQDSFPVVAVEAAQIGRPIIATRVGGLPKAIVDGETGLLVDAEDVQGFSAAITRLLGERAEARRMGQAARERATILFSFDRYVDAYDGLYAKVIARFGNSQGASPL
jgi:glycogen(starch) synthase